MKKRVWGCGAGCAPASMCAQGDWLIEDGLYSQQLGGVQPKHPVFFLTVQANGFYPFHRIIVLYLGGIVTPHQDSFISQTIDDVSDDFTVISAGIHVDVPQVLGRGTLQLADPGYLEYPWSSLPRRKGYTPPKWLAPSFRSGSRSKSPLNISLSTANEVSTQ